MAYTVVVVPMEFKWHMRDIRYAQRRTYYIQKLVDGFYFTWDFVVVILFVCCCAEPNTNHRFLLCFYLALALALFLYLYLSLYVVFEWIVMICDVRLANYYYAVNFYLSSNGMLYFFSCSNMSSSHFSYSLPLPNLCIFLSLSLFLSPSTHFAHYFLANMFIMCGKKGDKPYHGNYRRRIFGKSDGVWEKTRISYLNIIYLPKSTLFTLTIPGWPFQLAQLV